MDWVTMHRFAIALFWTAALFALVMASIKQPVSLPGHPSDKVHHIVAFITLAVLAAWAYPHVRVRTIFFGLSLFGGLIEIVQMIPALNRDADWFDWLVDVVAVALTLSAVSALRRVRAASRP